MIPMRLTIVYYVPMCFNLSGTNLDIVLEVQMSNSKRNNDTANQLINSPCYLSLQTEAAFGACTF